MCGGKEGGEGERREKARSPPVKTNIQAKMWMCIYVCTSAVLVCWTRKTNLHGNGGLVSSSCFAFSLKERVSDGASAGPHGWTEVWRSHRRQRPVPTLTQLLRSCNLYTLNFLLHDEATRQTTKLHRGQQFEEKQLPSVVDYWNGMGTDQTGTRTDSERRVSRQQCCATTEFSFSVASESASFSEGMKCKPSAH